MSFFPTSYRYWTLNPDQDATKALQERAVVVAKEVIEQNNTGAIHFGSRGRPASSVETPSSSIVIRGLPGNDTHV